MMGSPYRSMGRVALVPPPSANRYWKTFRGRTVRSAEATAWLECASDLIQRNIRPATGSVKVLLELRMGKGVANTADLDNFIKVTMDALKPESRHRETNQVTKPGAGVIVDDSLLYVHEVVARILPEERLSKSRRGEAELFVEIFAEPSCEVIW